MFGAKQGAAVILSVISVLLFTSCSVKNGILSASPELNTPFETDVKIQAGELEMSGSAKRYGTGVWEMKAVSPETLAGLELTYNDDGVKASLDDLKLDIPMENIRDGAVFAQMFKALDSAAAAGELSCTQSEDGMVYSGEFSGGPYTLTFDPETLAPVKLEIPAAGIFGEFENYRVMTGETEETGTSGSAGETETKSE